MHRFTMAKFIVIILVLALVSASNSKIIGAAAGVDDDRDLQQRRETMAEVHRVFSNPVSAAAADSETTHRMGSFLKSEIGPLGAIFNAIRGMPENSAAEVRARDEAFDAAKELLVRHFGKLLAPHGSAKTADEEDDLAWRREAMAEVVQFAHPESAATTDAKTTHRLEFFLKHEMGPIEAIFHAILKMPEHSADGVRIKDEAFDAAMELLDRKFRLLLPQGRPKTDDDVGFAIGRMPESSAAEVRSKEEAWAAAKEMMSRHLGQLLPAAGSVNIDHDL
ncbi:hypothetical protein ACQ4PT_069959 [Festuca glaucescens]